jgi:predicted small metal-binding protein
MSVQTTVPTYKFGCPQCNHSFSGDDLAQIAENVAWHWNKEHNSDLRHRYEKIDTVEMGGHNVHENDWNITRIPIYLTSFDVIGRLGAEDGRAVQPDGEAICKDCLEYLPDEDDRVEKAPNAYYPEFLCQDCADQEEVEEKQDENRSLGEF